MRWLSMIALGALFGVGLGLSGMTHPEKISGFLDVFGKWDPTMIFVMMGAMLVHFALLRAIGSRAQPILDTKFHLPTARSVDRKLVIGAAVFGVGWGLGGYCPGPALVTLGAGSISTLAFVVAMAGGMLVHHVIHAPASQR